MVGRWPLDLLVLQFNNGKADDHVFLAWLPIPVFHFKMQATLPFITLPNFTAYVTVPT